MSLILNPLQCCNHISHNFQSYTTCFRDKELPAVAHAMLCHASGPLHMLQTFPKCPWPCDLSDRLWSQSLTSPSREHLSFLYILWSLDIFHIFCLSKLQYSYLCTHPATVPYYQFSVTDKATLNQNQKPVEKDFSLQIESRKKC